MAARVLGIEDVTAQSLQFGLGLSECTHGLVALSHSGGERLLVRLPRAPLGIASSGRSGVCRCELQLELRQLANQAFCAHLRLSHLSPSLSRCALQLLARCLRATPRLKPHLIALETRALPFSVRCCQAHILLSQVAEDAAHQHACLIALGACSVALGPCSAHRRARRRRRRRRRIRRSFRCRRRRALGLAAWV